MTPRRAILIGLAIAPMLILSVTSFAPNGKLFYLGMLPAAVGLMVNVRVAAAGGLLTGALMVLAIPIRDEPVFGALFMAVIGAIVGVSSMRGWHGVGAYAGPQTSFALIGAPMVALTSGTVAAESSGGATWMMGASVAAGGLWIAFVGWLARHEFTPKEPRLVPPVAARYFAVALAVLAGAGAFLVMQFSTLPNAWWLLLTLFVVIQPFYAATLQRSAYRVFGTVLGAVFAAVVAKWLEDLPLVVSIVTLVVTFGAAWAYAKKPYWVYVTFLTPAVILQTSGGSGPVLFADLQRVAFTVGAAAVAVGVLTIGHQIVVRHQSQSVQRA